MHRNSFFVAAVVAMVRRAVGSITVLVDIQLEVRVRPSEICDKSMSEAGSVTGQCFPCPVRDRMGESRNKADMWRELSAGVANSRAS
jgi:hypothetical protein